MERLSDDELISAYLDDELSADERAYVERITAERPEARRLLEELRALRESLQTLPSYKLEPDFGAQVLERAEREVLRPATVNRILPQGDRLAEQPARGDDGTPPRWRRPVMWSILAVAGALVLMVVDRGRDAAPELAMNDAAKQGEVDKEADRRSDGAEWKDAAPPADAPHAVAARPTVHSKSGDAVGVRAKGAVDPSAVPPPAAAAPAPAAPPAPAVAGGGLYNPGLNTLPSTSDRNVAVDGVQQPTMPAESNRGASSVAVQVLAGPNQAAVAAPDAAAALSQQYGVDATPAVAGAQRLRGLEYVRELQDARRGAVNEDAALQTFNSRMQSQQLPAGEPLMIVCVDVQSLEDVQRGLTPVLLDNGIADLTDVAAPADAPARGNGALPEPAAARNDGKPAETTREEYLYVVADPQQNQAIVEAMLRQPQIFNNVSVEPGVTTEALSKIAANASGGAPPLSATVPSVPAPPAKSALEAGRREVAAASQPIAPGAAPLPTAAPRPSSAYSYVPQQMAPLSRALRLRGVAEPTAERPLNEAAELRLADEAQAKRQDAPAAGEKPAPATATFGVAPADPRASGKNDVADQDALKLKERESAVDGEAARDQSRLATQRQVDQLGRPAANLPMGNAFAYEQPQAYQEALFIFRVASPAENAQTTSPAADLKSAPAVAAPTGTGPTPAKPAAKAE